MEKKIYKILLSVFLVFLFITQLSAQNTLQQGINAVKKGDFLSAVNILSEVVKKEKSYDAYYYYGEALLKTGSFAKAEEYLKKALSEDDEGINAILSLGKLYTKQKKYDLAESYYKRGLKIEPENINLLIGLADNFSEQMKIDDAIKVLTLATTYSKENPKVYIGLGEAYLTRGTFKLAEDYFKKAISLNQNIASAYVGLGQVYFKQKKYNQALVELDKGITKDPNYADAYLLKGKILYFGNSYSEAAEAFNQYSKLMPGSQEGNSYYAKTLYAQGVQYIEKNIIEQAIPKLYDAMKILDDVIKNDPKSITGNLYSAYIYTELADIDTSNKVENYNKAIDYFKKVDLKNYEVEDLIKLAKLYSNLKNFDEAFPLYEKALKIDSTDAQIYYEWGKSLYKSENYSSALGKFQSAQDLGMKGYLPHLFKGFCYYSMKKYEDAIPEFKSAVEANPTYILAKEFLARAYRFAGKTDDAIKAYELVLEADPGNQEAIDVLKVLKKSN